MCITNNLIFYLFFTNIKCSFVPVINLAKKKMKHTEILKITQYFDKKACSILNHQLGSCQVKVSEWLSFLKELLTRLNVRSNCNILVISEFGFEGGISVLF